MAWYQRIAGAVTDGPVQGLPVRNGARRATCLRKVRKPNCPDLPHNDARSPREIR
jgi:hypothetical protein